MNKDIINPLRFINMGECPNCLSTDLEFRSIENSITKINEDGSLGENATILEDDYIICNSCNKVYQSYIVKGMFYRPITEQTMRYLLNLSDRNINKNIENPFEKEI